MSGLIIICKTRNRKPLILSPKRKQSLDHWTSNNGNYVKPSNVNLSVPVGYYDDYEYAASTTGDGYVSKKVTKPNIRFHRVTIETWKPFEKWCHEADQRAIEKGIHARAVKEMIALDRQAGITTNTSDGLD